MKRIIFSLYDNLNRNVQSEGFDAGQIMYTKAGDTAKQLLVDEYFQRLIDNKSDYAEKIGVEFKFYHNTMRDFDIGDELEFTKVNLYKHHLMAELAEEYDEIMYVDMDVLFNTDLNVFEEHDLSKGLYFYHQDADIKWKDKDSVILSHVGLRSPALKYFITKDLLDGKDNHVINTGIILGNSESIKQIRFIERMKDAIAKIEDLKKLPDIITDLYYPNNESVFSYIVEKYNIPYVILDPMWHRIYNAKPSEGLEGHCMHFINKQFNHFFDDKTKAMFSMYIEIPDDRLDNPKNYSDNPIPKSKLTQIQMAEYESRLTDNKIKYAEAVGAEYFHYERDDQYEEFYNRFPNLSEYDVINLYKIYLLDKLTHKYDFVMYVDLDVYFRNHGNIFNSVPVNHAICCLYEMPSKIGIKDLDCDDIGLMGENSYIKQYKKDFRNPQAKYWNAHALLTEDGYDGYNNVFNTGVVLASRYGMNKLDYFSDIEEVLACMEELKDPSASMYPSQIVASFGYDNETIFGYKVRKNNVLTYRLEDCWHHQHHYENAKSFDIGTPERESSLIKLQAESIEKKTTVLHMISKNFGLVFNKYS